MYFGFAQQYTEAATCLKFFFIRLEVLMELENSSKLGLKCRFCIAQLIETQGMLMIWSLRQRVRDKMMVQQQMKAGSMLNR